MAKKRRKKKQSNPLVLPIWGLCLIGFSILAAFKFGWLGNQMANVYRFFVGDSYLLLAVLLIIFGLVLLIYNQPPHFTWKRNIGLVLIYLQIMLIMATNFFTQNLVHDSFFNAFMKVIGLEFGRGAVTQSVGGGLVGTALYAVTYPLLDQAGSMILALLLLLVGILMFFNIKFSTFMTRFQETSQDVISKNKAASQKLKDRYQQMKAEKAEKKLTFPNTSDFDTKEPEGELPEAKPVEYTPPVVEQTAEPIIEKPAEEDFKPEKIVEDLEVPESERNGDYEKPPLSLLANTKVPDQSSEQAKIKSNTDTLQKTFDSFGVDVIIKKAILGPTVTRYEVQPAVGVKVSRIVNLADDLALALAAKDIRIEAPIPGKPYIGIEVPNAKAVPVAFKDVLEHQPATAKNNPMIVPLGKNVGGAVVSADLCKMPHLLVAGSTGSGKSVAINTILSSILFKANPDDVKLILIDPKMVELSVYNHIPHLLIPVVTDPKLAAGALNKAVKEMERRYKLFAAGGVRNMEEYNQKAKLNNQDKDKPAMPLLPYIVVVVDELSDLMMVGGREVEGAIVRLGQMARAAGIHMILATQRPSVDVITGLIKANVPSRISFAVSSGIDSRTILDQVGAEKLLGRGDMLFMPIGASKPERVQGAYISSDEVQSVIDWTKKQQGAEYDESMIPDANSAEVSADDTESDDEYFDEAVELVRHQQSASVSMLQRRFRIGYNRAARIVDEMEAKGIVGPSEGAKPRQVLLPPLDEEEQQS
ncbi:MAG: DNA translocase FtsK 4TM domain-containing protein [Lactobacillus sp.]|nr:DNA translocase FtsK 4TM domain-containing protein [Lactobacillus sp.]